MMHLKRTTLPISHCNKFVVEQNTHCVKIKVKQKTIKKTRKTRFRFYSRKKLGNDYETTTMSKCSPFDCYIFTFLYTQGQFEYTLYINVHLVISFLSMFEL